MSDVLDIRFEIDKTIKKLTVIVKNRERSADAEGVIAAVQRYADQREPVVQAYFGDSIVTLPQGQITRIFIDGRKVCVQTRERSYELRKPLKEIEDLLDGDSFVRISQSEIINIRKVKSFDFSIAGTIGVILDNGESTFVARRRVRQVKEALSKSSHMGHGKEE